MKKRQGLFLICTALAIWAPQAISLFAQSQSIVISEFRTRGPRGGNDEFIELHNASSAPINVGNWRIRASNSTPTGVGDRRLIPVGTVINPGCYYLVVNIGSAGYSGAAAPDLTFTTELFDNGGLAVTLNNGVVVDQAGMSSGSAFKEGTPLAPLLGDFDRSYERQPGTTTAYRDTQNNAADFQIISPSTPRNAASRCLGTTDPILAAGASPNPVVQQDSVLIAAAVTPGALPASTGLQVTADLSALGWSSNQPLYDDGNNGDAVAGDNIFSYLVPAVSASAGTHTVTFLVADAQSRTGSTTLDVVVEPMPIIYQPHDVQGPSTVSPLQSQMVAVDGVVTARATNGVFIQTAPGQEDGDPATSEGLFVFTGTAPPAEAAVGTLVRVHGVVAEFSSDGGMLRRTQVVQPSFTVLGTSALPAAMALTSTALTPDGGHDQLERFEGMRADVASLVTISGSAIDGTFYAVLTGAARPAREAGLDVDLVSTFASQCALGTSCNIPVFDGNPERLRINTNALGAPRLDVTAGVVINGVSAIVDSGARTWALLPQPDRAGTNGPNASPIAVAMPTAYHFTVGSLNVGPGLNLTKASMAVRSYLQMPDIIAVQGAASFGLLQELATRINADYTAHPGFLVRQRVRVDSVSQDSPNDLFSNPPVVLRAIVDGPFDVLNAPVIVVSVDVDPMSASAEARAQRQQQTETIAHLLDSLQEIGPVVVVGDFNAFEVNDGLVDVVGTMRGAPASSDQVVAASPDLVEPDFALPTGYSFVVDGHAQSLDHVLLSSAAVQRFAGLQYARVNADFPEVHANDSTRVERFSAHDPAVAYFTFPPDVIPPVISAFTPSVESLWPVNHQMVPVSFALDATDNLAIAHCGITSVTSNEPVGSTADWIIDGPLNVRLRAEREPRSSGRLYTVTLTCEDVAGNQSSAEATVSVLANRGNQGGARVKPASASTP